MATDRKAAGGKIDGETDDTLIPVAGFLPAGPRHATACGGVVGGLGWATANISCIRRASRVNWGFLEAAWQLLT